MRSELFASSGPEGLRRRRRLFDQGELRLILLHSISEKPRYGYEIIKSLEEQSKGIYNPSPGIIYPTLTLLEELNYVTVASREDGKKIHSITPEGKAFLEANREALEATHKRVAQTLNEQPAPQILRAMENLKFALRLRLAEGPLSTVETKRIAAILDKAALQVEQK
jgi:DNA-binding PadR family transcriptional regulator